MDALLDPNVAFLLLVAGALALYWELHAPGVIIPGAIGVLLICVGAFGLYQDAPTWYGVTLLFLALVLLALEMKFYSHGISGLIGAVFLALGAMTLIRGSHSIHPLLAISVAVAVLLIVIFLGLLGMRARKRPHLTGAGILVGEFGLTQTPIAEKGTVLVRGEYWQARSAQAIPAGTRVVIEHVENLLLDVKQA